MNVLVKKIRIMSLIAFAFCMVCAVATEAIPQRISYQGKLLDAEKAPLNGVYSVVFKLYATPTSNVPLWTEVYDGTNKIQVTNGYFFVELGKLVPLTETVFKSTVFLGVKVGDDAEMSPRVSLLSVPYAFSAASIGDLESSKIVRTDRDNTITGNVKVKGIVEAVRFVGDGSGLTNLPMGIGGSGGGTFSGILPISQGGTGASTTPNARLNLGLGALAVKNQVDLAGNDVQGQLSVQKVGGVGLLATKDSVGPTEFAGMLTLEQGGTGATNVADARGNLGLGSLAVQNQVNLDTQTTGTLPISKISGVGKLATRNIISASDVIGLGNLATKDSVGPTDFAGVLSLQQGGTGLNASSYNDLLVQMGAFPQSGGTITGPVVIQQNGLKVQGSTGQFVLENGVVGIGTSNPNATYKLNVAGKAGFTNDINTSGNITANGNVKAAGFVGDGSKLTGIQVAASQLTGVVSMANGGTGGTTALEARANLGLGELATLNSIDSTYINSVIPISKGGTNAVSAEEARTNLGLKKLATQDQANLSTDVTGLLAVNKVSGLGKLATQNVVNLGTDVTGSLPVEKVSGLGSLAVKNNVKLDSDEVLNVLPTSKGGTGINAANFSDVLDTAGVLMKTGGTMTGPLKVAQNGLEVSGSTGQFILKNGVVGIGTSNPNSSYALNVGGRSGFSGDINTSGNINSAGVVKAGSFVGDGNQLTHLNIGSLAGSIPVTKLSGLGKLATRNVADLTVDTVGVLAVNRVSGLGKLATQNIVNLGSDVTGILPVEKVGGLGTLAVKNNVKLDSDEVLNVLPTSKGGTGINATSFNDVLDTAGVLMKSGGTLTGPLKVAQNGLEVSGSTGQFILKNGVVGIGTSNPNSSYALNIGGKTGISGDVNVSGNITNAGNITSAGTVKAGTFIGDGSQLTNLNMGSLTGSVPLSKIVGLAKLATHNSVDLGAADVVTGVLAVNRVSGLGKLATQNVIDLTSNDVANKLPVNKVNGLGRLATRNVIDLGLDVVGSLDASKIVGLERYVTTANNSGGSSGGTFSGILALNQGGTGSTTPAGARSNLGAASSGANGDITSLTGLTTPLSAQQGGTGINATSFSDVLDSAGVLMKSGGTMTGPLKVAQNGLEVSGSTQQFALKNGVVGIGTTNPNNVYNLNVSGKSGFSGDINTSGNVTSAGLVKAAGFVGDGSQITNLNMGALTGSVPLSKIVGLGALATHNVVSLASDVTGLLPVGRVESLGKLATRNVVDLTADTTGTLASTRVTGLGRFAMQDSINFATDVTGNISSTRVSGLGALAVKSTVALETDALGVLPTSKGGTGINATNFNEVLDNAGVLLKTGGTMTGALKVPQNGFEVSGSTQQFALKNGVVGIGTTNPNTNYALNVQGKAGISGDVNTSGNVTSAGNITSAGTIKATTFIGDGSQLTNIGSSSFSGTIPIGKVSGLGKLASQNVVNLNTDVTGILPLNRISSLGKLATQNVLNLGTDVAGVLPTNKVANLGKLATQNSVSLTTDVTGLLPLASGGTGAGTAVGARTSLGAAASGVNSDITSLTGLTTPLSTQQGGTGINATNFNEVLDNAGVLMRAGGTMTGPLKVAQNGLEVSGSTQQFALKNGVVGIGTTNPDSSYKLNVAGKTGISGDVNTSGNITSAGVIKAVSFVGDGSLISNIGSGSFTGTLPVAKITGLGALATHNVVNLSSEVTGTLPVGKVSGLSRFATQNMISLASDVSNTLPVTSGGTGATTAGGARTNLGAAASGANSDISSLGGLTTPLSPQQGGTGINATNFNEVLDNAGVLMRSGGVMTGALKVPQNGFEVSGSTQQFALRNGVVGIGTTNPDSAYKLTVAGKAGFTNDINTSGNITSAGVVRATSFAGDGSLITNINTSAFTGTVPVSKITGLGKLATHNAVDLGTEVSNVLSVVNGGTGVATLTGYVRGNGTGAFTAVSSIPSSDISGTILVANGGTGATTASGARVNLGAAASGANGDITALNGLTTPLSPQQGGTGINATSFSEILENAGVLLKTGGVMTGPLKVAQNGLEVSGSTQQFALKNGVVGIGTTNPDNSYKLNVVGKSGFSGDINTSGNVTSAGVVKAGSFVGDGAGVVNVSLPTTTGFLPVTRISGITRFATQNVISLITDVTGNLGIHHGGTGATTAAGARANLGLGSIATKNSIVLGGNDVSGVLPLTAGGTGATTAAGVRANISAAASGVNSDITALTGLTTALSVGQGGTGATDSLGARANLGLGSIATKNAIVLSGNDVSGLLPFTKVNGLGLIATKNAIVLNGNDVTGTLPLSKISGLGSIATKNEIVLSGNDVSGLLPLAKVSGIGAIATKNSISLSGNDVTGTLPLTKGGTGATDSLGARANLGLGSIATKNTIVLAGNDVSGTLGLSKGGTGATTAVGARSNLGLGSIATKNVIVLSGNDVSGTLPILVGGTGATTAVGARSNLGLGSIATKNAIVLSGNDVSGTLPVLVGGTGATTALGARSNLGLGSIATKNVIILTGNDVSGLLPISKISGLGSVATKNTIVLSGNDVSGTLPVTKGGTGATTAVAARTSLGLGSIATKNAIVLSGNDVSGQLPVVAGGTGATTAVGARSNLGLGSIATKNVIVLSGNDVSGQLPVVAGGTGATTAVGARANLGLGVVATKNVIGLSGNDVNGTLPLTKGGTGATDVLGARANLGLGIIATKNVIDLDSNDVTGVLPISKGGMGLSSVTGMIKGNGSSVSGILGTGSYTTRWVDNSTIGASSLMFDNGSRIGVGTSTPGGLVAIVSPTNNVLYLETVQNTGSISMIKAINANLAIGSLSNVLKFEIGTAQSNNNLGYMGFYSANAGSVNNLLTFGFTGADNLFNIRADGNVGVGTVSPSSKFSVGSSSQFQVNSTGAIVAATGISSSGTVALSTLSAGGYVKAAATTGQLSVTNNIPMTDVVGTVPLTKGGTGATTAAAARSNLGLVIGTDVQAQDAELQALAGLTSAGDKVPYFTGSGTAAVADLTPAGRSLVSQTSTVNMRSVLNAASKGANSDITSLSGLTTALSVAQGGTGTSTALTPGSVVFAGTSGVYSQDNANLFWDNTLKNLGIGVGGSPAAKLEVNATGQNSAIRISGQGNWDQALELYNGTTTVWRMYKPLNTTQLRFNDGTADQVTILNGGNVGLGTTTPANKLSINGGASIGSGMYANTAAPTNGLIVSGSVGIGTTAPTTKLEVSGGYQNVFGVRNAGATGGEGIWTFGFNGAANGDLNIQSKWDNMRIYLDTDNSASDSFEIYRSGVPGSAIQAFGVYDGSVGIGTTTPVVALNVRGVTGVPANSGTTPAGMVRFQNGNNVALDFGSATAPWAMILQSHDATNQSTNYPISLQPNGGSVGVGTTSPSSLFSVGTTSQFQVNSSGAIVAATGLNTSGTVTFSGLKSGVLRVNGSGVVTTGSVAVSEGGTGLTTPLTQGSIVFAGASGVYSQNNANLFWDNTNNRLGIGTTTPTSFLHVKGTTSGGTGDYTNAVGQLKLESGSGYVRTSIVGTDPNIAVVQNFQTEKDVFWGENADTGKYRFRGRDVLVEDGKVGIGTTTPAVKLDVNGALQVSNGSTAVPAIGATGGNGDRLILWPGTGSVHPYSLGISNLVMWSSVPAGSLHAWYVGGAEKMRLDTNGYVGIGTTAGVNMLGVAGNAAIGSGYAGTAAPANGAIIQGNVGIGTSSPLAILSIGAGSLSDVNVPLQLSTVASGEKWVGINKNGGYGLLLGYTGNTAVVRQTTSDPLQFWVNSTTAAMTMLYDGKVGIGTTTPAASLSVGSSSQFQVNSSGAIAAATGLSTSGTVTFSGLKSGVLSVNGSGVVSTATVTVAQGGTGATTLTGILKGNGTSAVTAVTGTNSSIAQWSSNGQSLGSSALLTDNGNRVGVGSATPKGRLAVVSPSTNVLYLENSLNTGQIAMIQALNPNLGVGSNTNAVRFELGVAATTNDAGHMGFHSMATGSNTNFLTFGLQGANDLMTILGSGRVGIGVTNPSSPLHIAGSTAQVLTIGNSGSVQQLLMGVGTGYSRIAAILQGSSWNNLALNDAGGNVGIGLTNPGSILSVNGNLAVGAAYDSLAAPANGAIFQGSVGVGTTSPTSLFSVGSTSQFQVNSSGAIVAATGIASTGAINFGSASSVTMPLRSGILKVNGSGTLATGNISISEGGTGTTTTFTQGSVVFAGASGVYSQNNAGLFWDNTNSRLGIGTMTPAYKLEVNGTVSFGSNTLYMGTTNGSGTIRFPNTGQGISWGTDYSRIYDNGNLYITTDDYMYMTVPTLLTITAPNSSFSGNLGVGTTTPATKLDVLGSIQVHNGSTAAPGTGGIGGNGDRLILWPGSTGVYPYSLGINGSTMWYSVPAGAIHSWYTGGTEKMRMDTNGNIGLGTSSPAAKLDVVGDIKVSGNIYARYTSFTPGGSGLKWIRIPFNNQNSGGLPIHLFVTRSIFDNSNTPYGGPTLEIKGFGRERHVGQQYLIAYYGYHGVAGADITHAAVMDNASGGYYIYLRLYGGVTYKIYTAADSTKLGAPEDNSTGAPSAIDAYALVTGMNIIGDTSPNLYVAGKIGIGDKAPESMLDVKGSAVIGTGTGARAALGLSLLSLNNNTYSLNTDIGDGNRQLSIVNNSTVTNAFAPLSFRVNPSGGAGNAMLDMKFVNINSSNQSKLIYTFNEGGMNDRFTMTSSGNLGIGTTSPQHKFTIGNSGDGQTVALRTYSTAEPNWKGGAAFGGSNAAVIMGELSSMGTIGAHNATLGSWANLAINSGGGNVGIGLGNGVAPNAAYKLDVSGVTNSTYLHSSTNDSWLPYSGNGYNYLRGTTYAFTGVWYDENDSNYYIDPSGSSRFNNINSLPGFDGNYPANSAIRMTPNFHFNSPAGYAMIVNWDNGAVSGGTYQFRVGNGQGADQFIVRADGGIFGKFYYDLDDSNYYVDPNGSARLAANVGIGTLSTTGDGLEVKKDWFDSSATNWGGGITMSGSHPTLSFKPSGNNWYSMIHAPSWADGSIYMYWRNKTVGTWFDRIRYDQDGSVYFGYNGGNIGIGSNSTNTPQKLTVRGTGDTYAKIVAGTGSSYSGVMLTETDINYGWTIRQSSGTDHLYIDHQDNTPSFTNMMTIKVSGEVGIGTTTPQDALEVKSGRIRDKTGYVAPVGTVVAFAGSTPPAGWLLCDGTVYNNSSYPDLQAVVAYTYGGNGTTTFAVPDLRDRNIIGKGTTFATLNQSGGEINHTMSVNEMPSHTHDFTDYYYAENNHVNWGWAGSDEGMDWDNHGYSTGNTTAARGGGAAFNVMDPYRVLNYIIKY